MELALKTTEWSGYDLILRTGLFSEEAQESIVPDACPDIMRVLSTQAYACINTKEVRDGRVELGGSICAQILYVPDGESGIRHLEVRMPFSGSLDRGDIRTGCAVQVIPQINGTDTRVLNPRKVYVKVEMVLQVSVFAPYEKHIAQGCENREAFGIQEREEEVCSSVIKMVRNKNFSFSDDLSLPGEKPDLEELLSCCVDTYCAESKVIGNKLIFKGRAMLHLLYRSNEDQLADALFELPYSQIMEVEDIEEGAECEIQVILADMVCHPDREDPRSISVSMSFIAQAILSERKQVKLLVDLYSTSHDLSVEFTEEEWGGDEKSDTVRQDIRGVIETPVSIKKVIQSNQRIGNIRQIREGKQLQFSADMKVQVLYQGENGEYSVASQQFPVAFRVEADHTLQYDGVMHCTGEQSVVPTAGGIEVRLPLELSYHMWSKRKMGFVARVCSEGEKTSEEMERPSVVLRMAEGGENLWDIAKAYLTTQTEIMEVNGLESSSMFAGQILLIPRRR